MEWLRKRDEKVRSEMAALINEGFTGGEALSKAWHKLAHIWIIRDGARTADSWEDSQPQDKKRKGTETQGAGSGKGPKQIKLENAGGGKDPLFGVKRASFANGAKLCGAFNGSKGCVWNERNCPKRAKHACNVIKPNGEVCLSTTHGASGHF